MKLKDLLDVIERAMKDTSPRASYYAEALRYHMVRTHKDLLDEDVKLE